MAGRQRTGCAVRHLPVLIYIQRNLDGDLSLETLAGRAAFSSYHIHRIFTAAMGETLGAHAPACALSVRRWRYAVRP